TLVDGSATRIDTARGGTSVMLDRAPTAAITANPSSGFTPFTATFDASGSKDPDPCDGIAGYTFDFGDGSAAVTTTSPVVSHVYSKGGTFTASVVVADNAGLTSGKATTTVSANSRPVAV